MVFKLSHFKFPASPKLLRAGMAISAPRSQGGVVWWLLFKILLFWVVLLSLWLLWPATANSDSSSSPPTSPGPQKPNSAPVEPKAVPPSPAPAPAPQKAKSQGEEPSTAHSRTGSSEADLAEPGKPPGDPAPQDLDPLRTLGNVEQATKEEEKERPPNLLEIPPEKSGSFSYLDLCWSVWLSGLELAEDQGKLLQEARNRWFFQNRIYEMALAAASSLPGTDNPRQVLLVVAEEVFERQQIDLQDPDPRSLGDGGRLLPPLILARKKGSPMGAALLLLAVLEAVRPSLPFQFVAVPPSEPLTGLGRSRAEASTLQPAPAGGGQGAALGFRRQGYAVHLLLTTEAKFELLTPQDLLHKISLSNPSGEPSWEGAAIAELTRQELHGFLCLELGHQALQKGRKDLAARYFQRSLELQDRWLEPELELAKIAQESMERSIAIRHLQNVLSRIPDFYPALELRAQLYLESGERALARREFLSLLERFPDQAKGIYRFLGNLELESGNWRPALSYYRESSRREEDPRLKKRQSDWLKELELFPEFEALLESSSGRSGQEDYGRRFTALKRISRHPTPLGIEGLIAVLDDANLRFARRAWRALRHMTGKEIEFSKEAWSAWWFNEGRQSFVE
ncbi:MAG: hypothetical protein HY717_04770 [Planctomycetes bacterium]|nr:hypothetical protein [Planctomycetota bacterium]